MQSLLEFLRKNGSWFVFIFLEVICFYFIFTINSYQKSVFLNSTNGITGYIYSVSGNVETYFGLREQNQELINHNIELEKQVLALKDYIYTLESNSIGINAYIDSSANISSNYEYLTARVINSSISQLNNTITINKGTSDGVKLDVGVISQNGVVGVVTAVSSDFAIVQPILNPNTRIGCKLLNSAAYGVLVWEGGDPRYAQLRDYPKYEKFEKGDTIVTSGYSEMFPEGVKVGIVEDYKSQVNDNFYSLKVKLFTDFTTLKDVILINNLMLDKQKELENRANNAKR